MENGIKQCFELENLQIYILKLCWFCNTSRHLQNAASRLRDIVGEET